MRKVYFLLVALVIVLSFVSCTEEDCPDCEDYNDGDDDDDDDDDSSGSEEFVYIRACSNSECVNLIADPYNGFQEVDEEDLPEERVHWACDMGSCDSQLVPFYFEGDVFTFETWFWNGEQNFLVREGSYNEAEAATLEHSIDFGSGGALFVWFAPWID